MIICRLFKLTGGDAPEACAAENSRLSIPIRVQDNGNLGIRGFSLSHPAGNPKNTIVSYPMSNRQSLIIGKQGCEAIMVSSYWLGPDYRTASPV